MADELLQALMNRTPSIGPAQPPVEIGGRQFGRAMPPVNPEDVRLGQMPFDPTGAGGLAKIIGRIRPAMTKTVSTASEGMGKLLPRLFSKDVPPMTSESIAAAKAAQAAESAKAIADGVSPHIIQGRPDLISVGGETAFNATRPVQKSVDPMKSAYKRIMEQRGGRDPEAGAIDPRLLLYGGAAGGAGLMAKKAYDTIVGMKGKAQEVNQAVNPFRRTEDILRQINEANNSGTK